MEDFSSEENLGRNHGIIIRKEELSIEQSALIWSVTRSSNLHKEVTRVGLARFSVDSDNYRKIYGHTFVSEI